MNGCGPGMDPEIVRWLDMHLRSLCLLVNYQLWNIANLWRMWGMLDYTINLMSCFLVSKGTLELSELTAVGPLDGYDSDYHSVGDRLVVTGDKKISQYMTS